MSRVCEEFHLPVSAALRELAVLDLDLFEAALVAEESAVLMFEVMECRAFVAAKQAYDAEPLDKQATRAKGDPMMALVHELTYEAGMAKVRERQARAKERQWSPSKG